MEQGTYTGIYIGKEMCGFKLEHEYQFKLNHNGRTYELVAFYDLSIDEDVDLFMPYSSEKSIRMNWNIKEK